MPANEAQRHVVVLAPMPLEMQAIVTAFGLSRTGPGGHVPWTGRVGASDVSAIHIGMGPPLTRAALERLFDERTRDLRELFRAVNWPADASVE